MAYQSSHTGQEIDKAADFQSLTVTAGANTNVSAVYAWKVGRLLIVNGYIQLTAGVAAGEELFQIAGVKLQALTQLTVSPNGANGTPSKFRFQNTGGAAPVSCQAINAISTVSNYPVAIALVLS